MTTIKENFSNVHRVKQAFKYNKFSNIFGFGDIMSRLSHSMIKKMMAMDLESYDAIITFSPFHSINNIMSEVKKRKKNIFWVAQFGDPWANNPLELQKMRKFLERVQERKMLQNIDSLIHNSKNSLDLMLKNNSRNRAFPNAVLPHMFTKGLYPKRPKATNAKTIFRYVGTLFGNRSPEPIFKAFLKLFERRNDLLDQIKLEFIGKIYPDAMLKTQACLSLPKGMLSVIPSATYVKSLEFMYDADILLLIEADVNKNLFFPSKLADYMGANTPIVGISSSGVSKEICQKLGTWCVDSVDISLLSEALEQAIDYCHSKNKKNWCNEAYRKTFESHVVVRNFINFIKEAKGLTK